MLEEAENNLKKACRLTGATWAALVGEDRGSPTVRAAHGLPASKQRILEKYLAAEPGRAWFRGLNRKKHAAALRVSGIAALGTPSIWGYPIGPASAIVVGAKAQRASAISAWNLLAELTGSGSADKSAQPKGALRAEAAYNSQHGLEGVLASFLAGKGHQGGWLAIRRGEQLIIAAQEHSPLPDGAVLDLQGNALLMRVRRTRSGLQVRRSSMDWDSLPHPVDAVCRFWAAYPFVVNERFIGAVTVWGRNARSAEQMRQFTALARQVSQHVDLVVTLHEVANQLYRLATLNEFALALSTVEELSQMAKRVLTHLASLYPGHAISLYVPSADRQVMREFGSEGTDFTERTARFAQHPLRHWFSIFQQGEPEGSESLISEGMEAAAQFSLPLRYRGTTLGLLEVSGRGELSLSRYDRSMLAAMSSYMAGVLEHSRLRAEAVERAERMEETVRQLRAAEITAKTRLEAQQAAESQLVQAAKMAAVGEMAAGVAHELNNPLTTVSGFAELVLDEIPADAAYRADLEMVLHEARRARSVVRRLLDFARQSEQLKARADMNEIVEDVLALMTHFIHTSGVQLDVTLGENLPWVTLDSNQIKQVLLNLLHNALYAMPGGGHLQVRTELGHKQNRDWVVTHITDSGIGMDAAELERIFEPFYTTRAESGGTGLGLSVTYGIVTDHGGTIEVRSQRGAGSTFSVWLPV